MRKPGLAYIGMLRGRRATDESIESIVSAAEEIPETDLVEKAGVELACVRLCLFCSFFG